MNTTKTATSLLSVIFARGGQDGATAAVVGAPPSV